MKTFVLCLFVLVTCVGFLQAQSRFTRNSQELVASTYSANHNSDPVITFKSFIKLFPKSVSSKTCVSLSVANMLFGHEPSEEEAEAWLEVTRFFSIGN